MIAGLRWHDSVVERWNRVFAANTAADYTSFGTTGTLDSQWRSVLACSAWRHGQITCDPGRLGMNLSRGSSAI